MKKLTIAALLSLLLSVSHPMAAYSTTPKGCEQTVYTGPDGRLTPHLIARLPKSADPVVGFELVHNQALVAHPHRLVALSEKATNQFDVKDTLMGISVNQAGQVFLQTGTGFQIIGWTGLEPDKAITDRVHGRLYGSGSPVLIEVRGHQGVLQFIARKLDGEPFPIAGMKGTLRAASWNDVGLAAVVDNSLYVWEAGSKNIVRLLTDQGLSAAKDVVLVGHNRAVVSLRATVVLVTNEAMAVVTGMTRARCRFQHDVLYLLDGETGMVWTLSGLDQLGNKKGDQSYAADLLKQAPRDSGESSVQFREAARIIGCARAKQHLASARDVHASSTSAKH